MLNFAICSTFGVVSAQRDFSHVLLLSDLFNRNIEDNNPSHKLAEYLLILNVCYPFIQTACFFFNELYHVSICYLVRYFNGIEY